MPRDETVQNETRKKPTGRLYVVATPIGNREDITLRALRILNTVDIIAAEDTRSTGRFLAHHAIQSKLISYHEHNERERTGQFVKQLRQGRSVALVSNAGTPLVSDPGYRLVNAAVAEGFDVIPIPGVSAAITALSAAALPTDTFIFCGFPPRKKKQRDTLLQSLAPERRTLVFYESPRRILAFMDEIQAVMGDRQVVLAREMTKLHEEYLRGTLSKIIAALKGRPSVKGECTLLVTGRAAKVDASMDEMRAALSRGLHERKQTVSALSKAVAERCGFPKRIVYQEALKLKEIRKGNSSD